MARKTEGLQNRKGKGGARVSKTKTIRQLGIIVNPKGKVETVEGASSKFIGIFAKVVVKNEHRIQSDSTIRPDEADRILKKL